MRGAIYGDVIRSYYKEIPEHIRRFCEQRIDGTIKCAINDFENTCFGEQKYDKK